MRSTFAERAEATNRRASRSAAETGRPGKRPPAIGVRQRDNAPAWEAPLCQGCGPLSRRTLFAFPGAKGKRKCDFVLDHTEPSI
jgi:hypothetical protein